MYAKNGDSLKTTFQATSMSIDGRKVPSNWAQACKKLSAKIILDFIESKKPDQKLWVSTSGLGVFWLHLRLDSYPKYYFCCYSLGLLKSTKL